MSARKRRGKAAKSTALDLDKYQMYQLSVQEPEADIDFIHQVFRHHYGRFPRLLREDFCGTAYLACQWVTTHEGNLAWGIDLDDEPLSWGRAHNVSKLTPQQQERLSLVQGDVLEVRHQAVDVVAAFNFSFFTFQTRRALLRYFETARGNLREEGLLLLDLYGGPEAQELVEDTTEYDDFGYVWDQDEFDAVNNRTVCYIHFDLPDGQRMERAFSYDWRLWTIPELREALIDAGFSATEVYWEGTEEDTGEGDGEFTLTESAENSESWIAYLVAIK
ncbi:MAG: class I SAM-dependent methyltransferase [Acidobacteriota bacterium]